MSLKLCSFFSIAPQLCCIELYRIEPQREETYPLDMCAQRKLKTACTSAQTDQCLRYPHEETLHPWLSKNEPCEESDQTARMRRLIWIFTRHTCPKVRFLTLRLHLLKSFLLKTAYLSTTRVANFDLSVRWRFFFNNCNGLKMHWISTIITFD